MSDAAEVRLMRSIQEKWGDLIDLAVAVPGSPPAAFLAALIGNESGGNTDVTRFESATYNELKRGHPTWTEERLGLNATSWGLTQIMGFNYPGPPTELQHPATNLKHAVRMLVATAEGHHLNPNADFEPLFRRWNSGRIDGKTYDELHPEKHLLPYVPTGLLRMQIWREIHETQEA